MSLGPNAAPLFDLKVDLARSEVLSGAALPVVVHLQNTMNAGGQIVPAPSADHPFHYRVEGESGFVTELSYSSFLQQTELQPSPPRQQEQTGLAAGATLHYKYDLAYIVAAPLTPGTYQLKAILPLSGSLLESPAVTLTVVPPQVALLCSAPNGNRYSAGSVLVHLDGNGKAVLYQREGKSGKPETGILYARVDLPGVPTSLALTTDAEGTQQTRWMGWTSGSTAFFIQLSGASLLYSTPAVEVAPEVRLVSPGWVYDEEGVVRFLAVSPAGLSLITLPGRQTPRVHTFQEAGKPGSGAQVRAGDFRMPNGEHRILAIWNDGNSLTCSILNPAGQATAPRVLATRPEPLIAIDIESVGREEAPLVIGLFSSGDPTEALHLVRIKPGDPPQTSTVPAPPQNTGILAYQVLAGPVPLVLALGDKPQSAEPERAMQHALLWREGQAGWTTVVTSASEITHLSLVSLQKPLLVWASQGESLHYTSL